MKLKCGLSQPLLLLSGAHFARTAVHHQMDPPRSPLPLQKSKMFKKAINCLGWLCGVRRRGGPQLLHTHQSTMRHAVFHAYAFAMMSAVPTWHKLGVWLVLAVSQPCIRPCLTVGHLCSGATSRPCLLCQPMLCQSMRSTCWTPMQCQGRSPALLVIYAVVPPVKSVYTCLCC
jgi:hypothetical protein